MDAIKHELVRTGLQKLGFSEIGFHLGHISARHEKTLENVWMRLNDTKTHELVIHIDTDRALKQLRVRERKNGRDVAIFEESGEPNEGAAYGTAYKITLVPEVWRRPLALARFILAQKGAERK